MTVTFDTPKVPRIQPSDLPRMVELDGLRGCAILGVLIWHYVILLYTPVKGTLLGKLHMMLRGSWTGVDLFFVLSGFLIGSILLRNRELPGYYRAFYARRFLRILPLYFLFLVSVLVFYAVCTPLPAFKWMLSGSIPWWNFPLLLQNFGMAAQGSFADKALSITWSLCIEEQFYLMLPLLIRGLNPRHLPIALGAMILFSFLLRVCLLHFFPDKAALMSYVLLPTRWDPLLLGVLGAWLMWHPAGQDFFNKAARFLPHLFFAFLMVFAWITITAKITILSRFATLFAYPIMGGFYLILLLTLLRFPGSALAQFFRLAPLRWLGAISYGVYLFHEAIHGICHSLLGQGPGFLTSPAAWAISALAAGVTCLIASFSWKCFESRFVAIGHGFSYQKETELPCSTLTP